MWTHGRGGGYWARWERRAGGWRCSSCVWKASMTRYVLVSFPRIVAPIVWRLSHFRSRCKRCISRWARCCLTYGSSAPFVSRLCGLLRLRNWRKGPRGCRCGHDLVRDLHWVVWCSPLALVGNSSAENGCASTKFTGLPPIRLSFLPVLIAVSSCCLKNHLLIFTT